MKNKIITQSLSTLRIILISSLTIFTLYTVQAWVSPTLSAPNGNVGGPLTTATSSQIKTGNLGLTGSLVVGGFQMLTGAATGSVLTSDANGNARWATSTSGGWVDENLNSTADFDKKCEYRYMGDNWCTGMTYVDYNDPKWLYNSFDRYIYQMDSTNRRYVNIYVQQVGGTYTSCNINFLQKRC